MNHHTILLQVGPQGVPPTEFRVFAMGKNETSKGTFELDTESAEAVLAAFATHGMDRMPIDFDHGMVSGDNPKAAGWAQLEVRPDGLWATNVEWTPAAEQALKDREFRFISPAFRTDKNDRIVEVVNAALTNLPATKNALPLVAGQEPDASEVTQSKQSPGKGTENPMSEQLLKLLGAADEGEALVIATEINTLSKQLLKATGARTLSDAMAVVDANAALPAEVKRLSEEVDQLHAAEATRKKATLIDELVTAGKLRPQQRGWAERMPYDLLKDYGEDAQVFGDPVTSSGKEPEAKPIILSDETKALAKAMGLTEEEFIEERRDEEKRGTGMRLVLER